MPVITTHVKPGELVITHTQSSKYWLLCFPYLLFWIVPADYVYRLLHPSRPHHGGDGLVLIFFLYIVTYGLKILRLVTTRSRLTVKNARLFIERGYAGRMKDLGDYADGVLSDLFFAPTGGFPAPAGKITVRVGSVPILLADFLTKKDGDELKAILADAYHFQDLRSLAASGD